METISSYNSACAMDDYMMNNPICISANGIKISILKIEEYLQDKIDGSLRISGIIQDSSQQIIRIYLTLGINNLELIELTKDPRRKSFVYSFSHKLDLKSYQRTTENHLFFRIVAQRGIFSIKMPNVQISKKDQLHSQETITNHLEIIKDQAEISIAKLRDISLKTNKSSSFQLAREFRKSGELDPDQMEQLNLSMVDLMDSSEGNSVDISHIQINNILKSIREKEIDSFSDQISALDIANNNANALPPNIKRKIAIFTSEFEIITQRTPWAVNAYSLARQLSEGNEVHVFLVCHPRERSVIEETTNFYKNLINQDGIQIGLLPIEEDLRIFGNDINLSTSYSIYNYLKSNAFDSIIYEGGMGYYSLLAKALGHEFKSSTMDIFIESSKYLECDGYAKEGSVEEEITAIYLERESVNLAKRVYTFRKKIFDLLNLDPLKNIETIHLTSNISQGHSTKSSLKKSNSDELVNKIFILTNSVSTLNVVKNNTLWKEAILPPKEWLNQSQGKIIIDTIVDTILNFSGELLIDKGHQYFDYICHFCNKNKIPFKVLAIVKNKINLEVSYEVPQATFRPNTKTYIKDSSSEQSNLSTGSKKAQPPLVSICIPSRNRPIELRRAVDSALLSTYTNIELIIVDDGSDNPSQSNSLTEIGKLNSKIPISIYKENQNYPGYARNTAIGFSKGKYIFFLDDDNQIYPETIEILVDIAERKKLHFLTSAFKYQEDLECAENVIRPFLGPDLAMGVFSNILGDTFCLARRASLIKLGGFDTTKNASFEDWELFLRAAKNNYPFSTCPTPLGIYKVDPNGYTKTSNTFESCRQSILPYLNDKKRVIPTSIAALKNSLTKLNLALNYVNYNEVQFAKESFLSSGKVILSLSGDELESRLITSEKVTKSTTAQGLLIQALHEDPQLLLPHFALDYPGPIFFQIVLHSKFEDVMQIFYMTKDNQSYNEDQQISFTIKNGRNAIYGRIPNSENLLLPLRLDPGYSAGDYTIERIEIRAPLERRKNK